jgi:7,8-dihydro-6-hydroxymethylpterin-pyrophosphokinase
MISEHDAVLYLMQVCSKQVETLPHYYTTSRDFVEDPILSIHKKQPEVKPKDDD